MKKVFCCGCHRVRQADGSWAMGEFNERTDSSTNCPACKEISVQAMFQLLQKRGELPTEVGSTFLKPSGLYRVDEGGKFTQLMSADQIAQAAAVAA